MGKIGWLALALISGAAIAAPKAKKPVPVTKDARADWKKHMKAGWAKQKTKSWGEAVTEFEAALKAVPFEQRALAELGWSAMNAGDFVKARKTDEQVIAIALDDKVRASAYYNLGEVQRKTGDKPGAVRSYMASLQLRPNKIVAKAIVDVGGDPKKEVETCSDAKTPCDCARELAVGAPDDIQCHDDKPLSALPGFKVLKLGGDDDTSNSWSYLFDPKGHYVTEIAADYMHGRHDGSDNIASQDIKTVGGHKVLWLVVEQRDSGSYPMDLDTDAPGMEMEEIEDKTLTVCVLGDAKTPTTCPMTELRIEHHHSTSSMSNDPDASADAWDKAHPGSAEESYTLSTNLAADGTLTIKLDKGSADADAPANWFGPHKLW